MNFIDPENWPDVEELERQYQQDLLTPALVTELHEKLKDYFLRRTKEILNLPQKASIKRGDNGLSDHPNSMNSLFRYPCQSCKRGSTSL
jgi:hypothetical protein